MKAYIIDPKVTLGEHPVASRFFECCCKELQKHVETTVVPSKILMQMITPPSKEDVIVFFNRNDNNYPAYFIEFLKDVVQTEAQILPVAISTAYRKTPACIPDPQSYDVTDALERRKLTDVQLDTIAIAFARDIISILQPTLTRRNMVLFLSHRRVDGERIAGAVYDELCLRAQEGFRDLSDILVGQKAQEIIESNLQKSDAVIFLDTPQSGQSEWVKIELQAALRMNLPIVWIKLGSDKERMKLKAKPADVPHFVFRDVDLNVRQVDPELVESAIHKAFEISRENAKNIFSHLRRIRELERAGKINLELLDQQQYLYQVNIPRQGFRYVQKPITHVVGLFGRVPQEYDKQRFNQLLGEQGYSKHPKFGHFYDSAILLAPMVTQNSQDLDEEPHFIDSCNEYVSSLELYLRGTQSKADKKRGIIISGAFPDCQPEYQQNLWNALHAFVQGILDRNGVVIFGAHPTFQQLIFDIARLRRPHDYIESVHMYISKRFAPQELIDEYKNYTTVTATDAVEHDRAKSLSAMRRTMIQNSGASCMVVIGGKTDRPGISPGVDEEVKVARAHNIPVFLIGSVGGRTAEIASEMHLNAWKDAPNDMTPDFNEELMISLDYGLLANKLFDKIGY